MEYTKCDFIVVLGCSLSYREVLLDRVRHAVEIFKQGGAPRLLLSGGPNNSEGTPESHVMREMCTELGAPESALVVEDRSLDTLENARFSEAILREHQARRAYLVTSAYHSYRSGIIFRRIVPGVEFVLSPCSDKFSPEELARRMNSEERLLGELGQMGFDIPPR